MRIRAARPTDILLAAVQPSTPAVLGPGSRLDRYEIVRAVAQGGMGAVWLGRFAGAHGFAKQVAIKTILPEFAADRRFHGMFLDEARISSRLEHANVAQILDLGEHEGTLYIAFEWVEGSSVEQICRIAERRGRPVPLPILLRIVADACAGLHAAHELTDERGERLQVVHRDVTPDNILVRGDGCVKVIDFGVAKAKDRIAGDTRSGLVKGTPEYMAPEQACGNAVDRRADVWSLGAVLYRALAGGPPFPTRDELAAFIVAKRDIGPLPPAVPEPVRAIVSEAMQRFPGDRYATAEDLRRALDAAMIATGAAVSPPEVAAYLKELTPAAVSASPSEVKTAPLAPSVAGDAPSVAGDAPSAESALPYASTELAKRASDREAEPRPRPAAPSSARVAGAEDGEPIRASAERARAARRGAQAGAPWSRLQTALVVAIVLVVLAAVVTWFAPAAPSAR